MTNRSDPSRLLPMTPLSLAILVALADGALHGYAIIKAIERDTRGEVEPAAGTLYAALERMEGEGLLEECPAPAGALDARRRYYALTDFGRDAARAEVLRLTDLVALAERRHLGPQP